MLKKNDARALMVLGTASHAGKSILTAALCRIFADDGYRVAPFKAQNMSLNSAATPDGREIGRAQALQAEACRVPACAEMNPVLIKPSSDTGSQIVLLGRIWGQVTAANYHQRRVEELFPVVLESYRKLASQYDLIILEGAGSPAEINLREHDIVNMRMAHAAGAACLLVGDIDRGGVFASLVGTLELLEPSDRALIRGYAINKFRGDISLLRPGLIMMEPRLKIPCVGVVPYLHDLGLDEEDGVAVEDRRSVGRVWRDVATGAAPPLNPLLREAGSRAESSLLNREGSLVENPLLNQDGNRVENPLLSEEGTKGWCSASQERRLRIAVIALPHMANFSDFDALAAEPAAALAFVDRPNDLSAADLVILPGTKQTLNDLEWLHQRGLVAPLFGHAEGGGCIAGICGGFQMLGVKIDDPQGIENHGVPCARQGLGLLRMWTVLQPEKITRLATGRLLRADILGQHTRECTFRGYEIHVGETVYADETKPFAEITRAGSSAVIADGAVSADRRVFGTYIHGIFDDDNFRHAFLDAARAACGLAPHAAKAFFAAERQSRLDRLAAHVRQALDLEMIRGWLHL
ncbi:MAG: cobyric acid synthase [Terriglobia bacterium]|jgi:adenosylcobyric acid synthase